MKKITLGTLLTLVLMFSYLFFQYGTISPVDKITGCYIAKLESTLDKICLYESGKYEQFFIIKGKTSKYNENTWKNKPYSNDEGDFTAGLLHMFVIIDVSGKLLSKDDLYIQPHNNTFGKTLFAIGGNATRNRRTYFRVDESL